ncbi:hypothetical protein [Runella sp.]|uniref:hypothetical protein n=1 Tax=Runella sp. TaxID=1960881 RepID=UPI003D118061
MKTKLLLLAIAVLVEIYRAFSASSVEPNASSTIPAFIQEKGQDNAIIAGVLGIAALLVTFTSRFILTPVGIMVGSMAVLLGFRVLRKIQEGHYSSNGRRWAWTGIIVGGLTAFSMLLSGVFFCGDAQSLRPH